jgi:hypothetical protein
MQRPNCHQCKHFYITWNQKIPNGCKKFGIQCRELPSAIVKAAGMGDCQGFTPKKSSSEKSEKLDLNRNDLW